MGLAKKLLELRWERRWALSEELYACPRHFPDELLAQFVSAMADEDTPCTYCSPSENVPGCDLESILEVVGETVHHDWNTASNAGVPWEGGWGLPTHETSDVLYTYWESFDEHVFEDILSAFDDEAWVPQHDPKLSPKEILTHGWEVFVATVKHKTRYMWWPSQEPPSEEWDEFDSGVHPSKMLERIGEAIVEAGLITGLLPGTTVYRARTLDEPIHLEPKELAAPPSDKARQNRMSPAGISMFYGATDVNTAAAEVYNGRRFVSVGAFHLLEELRVIDFSNLPSIPSRFDLPNRPLRDVLTFLQSFIRDLSKPIDRDDRVHVEYVPTQIVTEFLRTYALYPSRSRIDGMIFPSSRRPGGNNVVLFFGHEACLEDEGGDRVFLRVKKQRVALAKGDIQVFEYGPPTIQPAVIPPLFDRKVASW